MDNREFEREDRYAVIKYKKLTGQQWTLVPELLEKFDKARVDCVVVEKDWPEYHLVWAMLEHRMAGKPVPDFNLWRQADELQQRLTVAKQLLSEALCHAQRMEPISVSLLNRIDSAIDTSSKPTAEGEGS